MAGRRLRPLFISFILLAFLIFPHRAVADQATLSWTAPATNTDDSPLTDLAGYKVYYGTASRSYSQVIIAGNSTAYTVANLAAGTTYYFATTAYDASGNESAYSNEVSKTTAALPALTITKTGSGTVTGPSINCGTVCAATYSLGTVLTLNAAPDSGWTFNGWSGGGCSGTGTCSLTMNAAVTVTASFVAIPSFTITATAGSGGAISPSGSVNVNKGGTQTFTITPNNGYTVSDVTVDGVSVGAVAAYTFANVAASHSITSTFVASGCANLPVKIARATPLYFSTLQAAYNAAQTGDVIQSQAVAFAENLNFNRAISVSLEGGFDCSYATNTAATTVTGTLTLGLGSVSCENVVF